MLWILTRSHPVMDHIPLLLVSAFDIDIVLFSARIRSKPIQNKKKRISEILFFVLNRF
jgi:hypothetical protein